MNAPEQSTDNLLQTYINILSQSRTFREKFPQRIVTIAIKCCLNHKQKLFNNLIFKNSRKREDKEK